MDRNVLKTLLKGLFYSFGQNTAHSKSQQASILFKTNFSSQNIEIRIVAKNTFMQSEKLLYLSENYFSDGLLLMAIQHSQM